MGTSANTVFAESLRLPKLADANFINTEAGEEAGEKMQEKNTHLTKDWQFHWEIGNFLKD